MSKHDKPDTKIEGIDSPLVTCEYIGQTDVETNSYAGTIERKWFQIKVIMRQGDCFAEHIEIGDGFDTETLTVVRNLAVERCATALAVMVSG